MMVLEKCGICFEKQAKYKCPKCSVRYCSLVCYKDLQKHLALHGEESDLISKTEIQSEQSDDPIPSIKDGASLPLATPSLNKVYQESMELKELLQYNTVKFHLAKVHRILCTDVADSDSNNMSTDMKKQLAIDYLNTLRYGGIHYNEAVEEFCQIYLASLESNA